MRIKIKTGDTIILPDTQTTRKFYGSLKEAKVFFKNQKAMVQCMGSLVLVDIDEIGIRKTNQGYFQVSR